MQGITNKIPDRKQKGVILYIQSWLERKRNCEGYFKKIHLLWSLLPNSMKLMFSFTYKSQELKILKFVLTVILCTWTDMKTKEEDDTYT